MSEMFQIKFVNLNDAYNLCYVSAVFALCQFYGKLMMILQFELHVK